MRRCPALLAVVVALGCLAGCGQSRPAPVAAPARLDQATVDMITRSGGYSERYHRVDLADVESIRRCMKAAGFTWTGVADAADPAADEGGGVSVDWVRQHGYGLSDDPPPPPPAGPAVDRTAEHVALVGAAGDTGELTSPNGTRMTFPRHGCEAQAHIAVYGDLDTWLRIASFPQDLNARLNASAKADPRYAAKMQEWSACMAAAHYSDRSPEDIVARLTAAYRTDRRPLAERRAAEITVAMRDVSCDKRVRMSATALQLRREYAQLLPAPERAEMTRLATLFGQALDRAALMPVGAQAAG